MREAGHSKNWNNKVQYMYLKIPIIFFFFILEEEQGVWWWGSDTYCRSSKKYSGYQFPLELPQGGSASHERHTDGRRAPRAGGQRAQTDQRLSSCPAQVLWYMVPTLLCTGPYISISQLWERIRAV